MNSVPAPMKERDWHHQTGVYLENDEDFQTNDFSS